jgi:hypothetical protein
MSKTLYSLQYLCAKQLLESVHPLGHPHLLAALIHEQYGPYLQETVKLLKRSHNNALRIITNKRRRLESYVCEECEHEQECEAVFFDEEDADALQRLLEKNIKESIRTLERCLIVIKK